MNTKFKNVLNKPLPLPKSFWGWLLAAIGFSFFLSLVIVLIVDPTPRRFDWPLAGIGTAGGTIIFLIYAFIRWLCCWRNLVRFVFGAACVATLVGLFYAEENWRGRHDWRQFEQACLAKGITLDFASVVPPRVPNDQNFAMTPIVYSSYGQILTRDGKMIPYEQRDPHFVERMRMDLESPAFNHPSSGGYDYEYNGNWAQGKFTKLKVAQDYYRAAAAVTNEFPVSPQPSQPAADVVLALSRYDGVIAELRAASRLSESRFPINYNCESPWTILLPHLAPLKMCALVLRLRSVAELQNNQPQPALEEIRLGFQLVDKVRSEPFLISHLVRLAMTQIMLQPVWEGLAQHRWSDDQLAALETELATVDLFSAYRLGLHGELGFETAGMDELRHHRSRIIELEIMDRSGPIGWPTPNELTIHLFPSGWLFENEIRMVRQVTDFYLPAADTSAHVFSPAMVHRGQEILAADLQSPSPFNWYERDLLPSLDKSAIQFAHGQASVDLARIAVALERYRLAQGEYPETLDVLAPKFITAVPRDVIGGQPLKYHRQTDGRFTLYSVGWNETDDGGKVVLGGGTTPAVDFEKGDWVWEYPAE
jgi:hypothetical protein